MAMRKPGRRSLRVTVLAALVAAAASLFVFLQSGESAQAADGASYSPYVVGGADVPDGEYRFVAALRNTNYGSTAFEQQFCGGALIDHNSVLTAAHCVYGHPASPLRVTVGRTVLNSDQGQTRRVSKIFVDPSYDPHLRGHAYDAAVLKLSNPVSGIAPIKLATAAQDYLETPGHHATVAGWGNTVAQPVGGGGGTNYPDRMQEAQVPIDSDDYAASVYGSSYHKNLMVAAGATGKDTCQGDSGGPMFHLADGHFTEIGITSFGDGCGAEGHPGVYTEVNATSIRDFITNAASK
jgi:secreted trypsin-like serine protease